MVTLLSKKGGYIINYTKLKILQGGSALYKIKVEKRKKKEKSLQNSD